MPAPTPHDNFSLKEEIRAYWSVRAETFDQSYGHAIKSDRELKAFQRLIRTSFGAKPIDVLDLACGTGEITRALLSLNHRVTALDFSEAMIERARAKHGKAARILLGDAEHLLDADASYDALITRHLVWTLTDPEAAFAEWFRVLRPGGRLLVIDGDWINRTPLQALINRLGNWLRDKRGAAVHQIDSDTHASISKRFFFKDGLSQECLKGMLVAAGFVNIAPADYSQVVRAQQLTAPIHDAIRLGSSTRFALLAEKR
ncbi:class I SAM-dependent methyltransferase [Bosea caraganae]|uniref:Class I SAM-dependent methyltransferase n=1 Tax=Bosea caraganae TaxID=2763117 RepID=A0A370LCV1_9HYPH|nr:class I SAM-dependent methyltransferase [Bosea caraganae]RDJ27789.1 class I SAM-dependent methyltransferase [Bosea caraganae]RDJ29802.1 class I SAM-dependent methyltransferase [Bosea caraganae]